MRIVGIDFGNESSFVAVAGNGGIETIDNDYSMRATPSTVAFGERNRILGVAAKNQLVTNIKNTIWGFKRFLGRSHDDPFVQEEIGYLPFEIVPHAETNEIAFQLEYLGENHIFTAEQITAMLFTKLRETTENFLENIVTECVLSVPSFFTDRERRALLAATQIAGLRVRHLLNETAATSLAYGIYKELPEVGERPRNVIFVDCGHSALQVWACAFHKDQLQILSSTSDAFLGGRDFDRILADHFCAEFERNYGFNPRTNHKAYIRLLTEVEKLKRQLSANSSRLPLNIECLMNEKDVTSNICREDFEKMANPLFQRVERTMNECFQTSNLKLQDIYSVEVVGGTTRIPAIKKLIEKVFGKPPSTTLNQDEAVARGCALQCANLSADHKFKIIDAQQFPIRIVWNDEIGDDGMTEVFPLYHPIPSSHKLTLYKGERNFQFRAMYCTSMSIPSTEIGQYIVKHIPVFGREPTKLEIEIRLTMDGILQIDKALAFVKTRKGTENDQENREDTETTIVVEPCVEQMRTGTGLTAEQVHCMVAGERKMAKSDCKEKERIDAKNALEEYIYSLKEKFGNDISLIVNPDENCTLGETLTHLESWLYDEGNLESQAVYVERLETLKRKVDPAIKGYEVFSRSKTKLGVTKEDEDSMDFE